MQSGDGEQEVAAEVYLEAALLRGRTRVRVVLSGSLRSRHP